MAGAQVLLRIAFCFVVVPFAVGQDLQWRAFLEPRFMNSAVAVPVPGAEKTVLTAGRWDGQQLQPFTKKEWQSLKLEWPDFRKQTESAAQADWSRVEVVFNRDKRGVIRCAELRSKEPLVAAAVLAPNFPERFEDTIGDDILLVVPNRYHAFLFPKLANAYTDYAREVQVAYRATPYPVSLELFQIAGGRWSTVGVFENQ